MPLKIFNNLFPSFKNKKTKKNKKEILDDIFSDEGFMAIYEKVKEYTVTSPPRLYSLYKAVEYIVENKIAGDFVECGVWRGGSAMTIALTLLKNNVTDRYIYMYDTYEGMSAPSEKDNDIFGNNANHLLKKVKKENHPKNVWSYSPIDEVKRNLAVTGYPAEKLFFIQGKVEDTIPGTIPEKIALLRLDTDWYESTLHEMQHLYPLLSQQGVLIIDDYGHWLGARKAVDEYMAQHRLSLLLNRVDYTARIAVKL